MFGKGNDNAPKGAILVDGRQVADTYQCVHCGNHFISVKGSKKIRGFCRNCMGVTCGRKECDVCVPFEKKIVDLERRFHA